MSYVKLLHYNILDVNNRIMVTETSDKPDGINLHKRMLLEASIWIHDGVFNKCRFPENQIPSPSEIIENLKRGQNVIL